MIRAVALLAGLCCAHGLHAEPHLPDKPHHTAEGFRNLHSTTVARPLGQMVTWRWQAWREDLPPPPDALPATLAPQVELLKSNGHHDPASDPASEPVPSATWIGHATVLVQSGGLNILTDPVFSERASPVAFVGPKRAQPPGIALQDLPPIDVVVISHNHYDHLDRTSVILLNERSGGRTLFLVPLGLKPFFRQQGITNLVELDWWDVHHVHGVDFQLVPVQHWSARSLGDRNRTLWGGWAVFADDLHWYYSGDAGYSPHFLETRERLADRARDGTVFDLALLPIGGYEPRWFMAEQHMNPAEAVQAHKDLAARHSLGVRWGTFELSDEPLDQPPKDLAAARQAGGVAQDDFFLLRIGETWWPEGAPHATAAKQ